MSSRASSTLPQTPKLKRLSATFKKVEVNYYEV
jgi:hypothetical protein